MAKRPSMNRTLLRWEMTDQVPLRLAFTDLLHLRQRLLDAVLAERSQAGRDRLTHHGGWNRLGHRDQRNLAWVPSDPDRVLLDRGVNPLEVCRER